MNKIVLGVLGVVVVLGLGAGYVVYRNGQIGSKVVQAPSASNGGTDPKGQPAPEETTITEANYADLLKDTKPRTCTFSTAVGGGKGEGTTYSDGTGKVQLVLTTTSNSGQKSDINSLIRDGKAYSWTTIGGKTQAFVTAAPSTLPSASPGGDPANPNNFKLSCKSWSVDASKFAVPAGVDFKAL
ncbi:MAG: hypothetical protein WCO19_03970 [Candidatus Saccharibacteria bacterium]